MGTCTGGKLSSMRALPALQAGIQARSRGGNLHGWLALVHVRAASPASRQAGRQAGRCGLWMRACRCMLPQARTAGASLRHDEWLGCL